MKQEYLNVITDNNARYGREIKPQTNKKGHLDKPNKDIDVWDLYIRGEYSCTVYTQHLSTRRKDDILCRARILFPKSRVLERVRACDVEVKFIHTVV